MKHNISLETRVSFQGDSRIYIVSDYQELLTCNKDCDWDHDCYEEPYLSVRYEIRTALPLSKLNTIFNEQGIGKPYVH